VIDTLAQAMGGHGPSVAEWLQHQITLGNIASVGTALIAFGYQLRRLQDIERDVASIREAQRVAMSDVAATYTRRDVLTETLASMNARLGNIETDLRALHHAHDEAHR
jgi:hypothetical protein